MSAGDLFELMRCTPTTRRFTDAEVRREAIRSEHPAGSAGRATRRCVYELLAPAEAAVRELLEIPDGVALAGHIAVGRRADRWPARLARNPVSDFTFGERYGEPWR
ncbi:MAG: hypothetical protein ACLP8S_20360 [Solirubrobacteraceae bacterium]